MEKKRREGKQRFKKRGESWAKGWVPEKGGGWNPLMNYEYTLFCCPGLYFRCLVDPQFSCPVKWLHLLKYFVWKIDLLILHTVFWGFDKKNKEVEQFLVNFGFVFVSLIPLVNSVTIFLPEIILAKYFILEKCQGILTV